MIKFLLLFIIWFTYSESAFAVGSIIAGAIFSGIAGAAVATAIVGFAINMVASMIISKIFAPNSPNQQSQGTKCWKPSASAACWR